MLSTAVWMGLTGAGAAMPSASAQESGHLPGEPLGHASGNQGSGKQESGQGAPAAQPVYPFRVVFSAPAGCGSAEFFSRQVRRRTRRLEPAKRDQRAVTFFLYLVRSEGAPGEDARGEGAPARGEASVRGQLGVGQPDGTLSFREVPGVNCNEVVDAMALIAALTFDLAANTEALPPMPAEPERESPEEAPDSVSGHRGTELGFSFGTRAGVRSAVSPDLALNVSVEAALTFLGGEIQPGIRLSGHAARGPKVQAAAGDAQFTLLAARIAGCPTRWALRSNWYATPCAWAELGVLNGSGSRIVVHNTERVLWGAAGLALHSELQIVGPLWLAAELSGFFPFRHDVFRFEPKIPDNELFRVPSTGALAALGLGLHFF
ncbi:MAG TPA: hypothetical protein VFQ61_11135 [Polyangiaceae bacterium]|nr:hypothetical protein [Polyangiaceae bacterium]